jgi:hypothetical protein
MNESNKKLSGLRMAMSAFPLLVRQYGPRLCDAKNPAEAILAAQAMSARMCELLAWLYRQSEMWGDPSEPEAVEDDLLAGEADTEVAKEGRKVLSLLFAQLPHYIAGICCAGTVPTAISAIESMIGGLVRELTTLEEVNQQRAGAE